MRETKACERLPYYSTAQNASLFGQTAQKQGQVIHVQRLSLHRTLRLLPWVKKIKSRSPCFQA